MQWHPTPVLLPGKTPWTEETGRLQSMGSLRVGHDWATSLSFFTFMHWRRKWQPTPGFLPGESQGRGSLVGCRLWGRTESDTTELTWQQQQHICNQSLGPMPSNSDTMYKYPPHQAFGEKEMATHSSMLAWRIPGTEEPGGLPSMRLHRVRHDWSDLAAATAFGLLLLARSLQSLLLCPPSMNYWFNDTPPNVFELNYSGSYSFLFRREDK